MYYKCNVYFVRPAQIIPRQNASRGNAISDRIVLESRRLHHAHISGVTYARDTHALLEPSPWIGFWNVAPFFKSF